MRPAFWGKMSTHMCSMPWGGGRARVEALGILRQHGVMRRALNGMLGRGGGYCGRGLGVGLRRGKC